MRTGTRHDAALVVFSGGQDSTTCLFWAKEHFAEVRALTFLYGQKHREEVNVAQRIARTADVAWDVLDASFIASIGTSALTDTRILMDSEKPAEGPPNTFVPGRNLFFLSMAAVYAAESGIRHLVTGVSETDFSGYPDCRDTFVRSLNVNGCTVRHPYATYVARQSRRLGSLRPPRCLRSCPPRDPHVLQRRPWRRLWTLSRLSPAP